VEKIRIRRASSPGWSRKWLREYAQPVCKGTNVPRYFRFIVSSKPINPMAQAALGVPIAAKRV
jgi:hypothetical protein